MNNVYQHVLNWKRTSFFLFHFFPCHVLWQVLGTDELNAYLNKYRIELDPHLAALVGRLVVLLHFFQFFLFAFPNL